jgi:hypothetical protein
MLYFIANPITVNKIRLDAGIKRDLESEGFVFVRVRKSNRLKFSAQKRQFDNLEGLTSPCKRKRKSSKSTTSATDVATEDTAVGTLSGHIESVSSASGQSTLRPWTLGSITDNSSPESSSTTENAQIGVQPSPLLSCPYYGRLVRP